MVPLVVVAGCRGNQLMDIGFCPFSAEDDILRDDTIVLSCCAGREKNVFCMFLSQIPAENKHCLMNPPTYMSKDQGRKNSGDQGERERGACIKYGWMDGCKVGTFDSAKNKCY